MGNKYFEWCFILCFYLLQHQIVSNKIESSCVDIAPTYMHNETLFVTGEIGKQLSVFCDINELCLENTLKTCFLDVDDKTYSLKPIGNNRYTYTSGIVTTNINGGFIGCILMSYFGEKIFRSRLLIVSRPYQIPILNFREVLFLHEYKLVECKFPEIAIPRPQLHFYINDKEVNSVALSCNKVGGCTQLGYINGLKRQWHGGKVRCCTSGPFGSKCSVSKILNLQFPPLSVHITHKVLSKSTSNIIVYFTCDINAARPACKVSWNHEGNVTDKGQMVAQERDNGIQTVSNIVLSLPIKPQVVSCISLCPLFNETALERLHVHLYHISNSTSDYDGYSSNDERITDWLIKIIFFSIFGNMLLGNYLFLTKRKPHNEKVLKLGDRSLPLSFAINASPLIKDRGSSHTEANTSETRLLYKRPKRSLRAELADGG